LKKGKRNKEGPGVYWPDEAKFIEGSLQKKKKLKKRVSRKYGLTDGGRSGTIVIQSTTNGHGEGP